MRAAAILLTVLTLAACSTPPTGPAAQPSNTDVNPISGNRGGSGSK